MIPFITSRTSTWRLLPPRLAGGINGSTCAHSASVRSLGYRSTLRSYRLRFFAVHIGDPSSNQATTLESQMIHWIQFVFGRTLSRVTSSSTSGVITRQIVSFTRNAERTPEEKITIPSNVIGRLTLAAIQRVM